MKTTIILILAAILLGFTLIAQYYPGTTQTPAQRERNKERREEIRTPAEPSKAAQEDAALQAKKTQDEFRSKSEVEAEKKAKASRYASHAVQRNMIYEALKKEDEGRKKVEAALEAKKDAENNLVVDSNGKAISPEYRKAVKESLKKHEAIEPDDTVEVDTNSPEYQQAVKEALEKFSKSTPVEPEKAVPPTTENR
ncbi:MAG: hypothetical protein WC071_02090 [Victivallaceae bacterium]